MNLWFHDTEAVVQKKYRYRMRLVFINPMITRHDVVYKGTPKDAFVRSINSAWSPWADAEAVPRTTQFFVTSAMVVGRKKQLGCTVFTRSLGQRVMEKFPALPGRVIGEVRTMNVKNPATGEMVKVPVDFSTGAIVVDIDFSKKVAGRLGSKETAEMICLENGRLVPHLRVLDLPKDDPRYMLYQRELDAVTKGQSGGSE